VVYLGDSRYAGSAADLTLTVVAVASKTRVTAKPATVRAGKSVRLTAKVTTVAGVTPSGTVKIVAVRGTTRIVRTVRLDRFGTAVLNLGPLAKGTYKITATYGGSGTVNRSVGSTITVKVTR
jgi:hypothetical protein